MSGCRIPPRPSWPSPRGSSGRSRDSASRSSWRRTDELPKADAMSAITTHVLDLTLGRPAAGVPVRLEVLQPETGWVSLTEKATDDDGRVKDLLDSGARLDAATYRLTFLSGSYFERLGMPSFHPEVTVVFRIEDTAGHYHVPLLLSPFGYSTYRGS